MSRNYPTERLLFKVFDDLIDFLPNLILVGGWIPYLYVRYIWPKESSVGQSFSSVTVATTTSDMDFGVMLVTYSGNESIADRVRKLGYGERHESMDRLIPFVPVAYGKDEEAEVEFITVLDPPKFVHEKLVGKEIKLNTLQDFKILLEDPITVSFLSYKVQIPKEEFFVFHKLLTFVLRENEEKLRKDLYYVYYMLRFSPKQVKLVNDVKDMIKKRKEGKRVLENLKIYFTNQDAKGPVFIEMENGPDYVIQNIRQDAYDRIISLLKV